MPFRSLTRSCAGLLAAALLHAAEADPLRTLVDRLRDLEAVMALIERESAVAVDPSELWSGATRGLVEAIDPQARYLAPDEVAIHGLGSEPRRIAFGFDWLREADGSVRVTRVVPESPAFKAGLHRGARIVQVDGVLADDRRAFAHALARGADSKRLAYLDIDGIEGVGAVERAPLDHDDGISYTDQSVSGVVRIRVDRFLPATTEKPDETATCTGVRTRLAEHPEARAVVLDLRGCAGGTVQAAVEAAAAWLPPGTAVIEQVGRDPARARRWQSDRPRLPNLPVVVLMDGDTASAAEVLALALHRGLRSPLVGQPTAGKWTVQQLFLLPRGDAMQLTVARLQPPGGPALDGPLLPTIAVPQDRSDTWRRWRAEMSGAAELPPDPQLDRAVDLATALAVSLGR